MQMTPKGYDILRTAFGTLTQSFVDGVEFLISKAAEYSLTYPEMAYVLATTYWESGHTMQPVTEKGSQAYLRGKKYYPYIGRGYCQITWERNYRLFSGLVNVDLVKHPELALDKDIAAKIMFLGMTKGLFTGVGFNKIKLGRYDLDSYIKARKIINGTDKAKEIANIAMTMEKALRQP